MKKILSLFIIGVLTISVAACSNKPNTGVSQQPGGEQGSKATKTGSPQTGGTMADNSSLIEKINFYVDCINGQSRVLESYDRYLSWVDKDKGPTGQETIIYGLYGLNDAPGCITKLENAKKANPKIAELDTAGDSFKAALSEINTLITEANDYYEQKNYKDDNMAKGKELHPKLMAAWQKFEEADIKLRAEVEKINSELEEKELAELEKTDGRKIPFLTQNSLRYAKKVLAEVNGEMEKINLDNLTKTIEEYDKALKELNDYIAANPTDEKISSISTFIHASKQFLTSVQELKRRIRDKVAFTTGEEMLLNSNPEMVEGTPAKVVKDYNYLIFQSNTISRFGW